jgi:iron complex transport system ATP-binding protein
MTPPPLIDIHDATIWRGQTRVFDRFSLTIEQHRSVAILGPNGSGKTTLLQTITRDVYPVARQGSWIRVLGRDRWDVWELRSQIGIVSQDLHDRIPPSTRVCQVVASGFDAGLVPMRPGFPSLSNAVQDRVSGILRGLGLEKLGERRFGTLSSGEQRRCVLGRALVHRPRTLILDEPTAGLDLAAAFDYQARIAEFTGGNASVVLVTHHVNEIPPEVQRIVMLGKGRVVADGTPEEVLTGPRLSDVYGTGIEVAVVEGRRLAYPAIAANPLPVGEQRHGLSR